MHPEDLSRYEDQWNTSMGLVYPGEKVVYRALDLFTAARDMPWMKLFLLGITGRQFDNNQIRLFEGIWVICTSYPDPRIWNNRIASLGGTARSTAVLSTASGVAASEAEIYGFKPIIGAHDFLSNLKERVDAGEDIEDIILQRLTKRRFLPGFARPLINADERITPLLEFAQGLGLADGHHTRLAFQVEDILAARRYRMRMNVAALAAALSADQGLSAREYYHYLIPCFYAGLVPCYIEASEREPGAFLPLRCSRISYEGQNERCWQPP